MPFFIQCLLSHSILIGYFWLANWYTDNLKSSIPSWAQTLIGSAYLASLLLSFYRVDLIAMSERARGSHGSFVAAPNWIFYVRVLAYYVVVLGLPATMFLQSAQLPAYLLAYGTFVCLAVLVNHVDYALPSYSRYRRLAAEGNWGFMLARS